jgi:serine/threonine-protein kinase
VGRYRLEELLGDSPLGPLFSARGLDAQPSWYLVRILAVPPIQPPEAQVAYPERFQQQASYIATLQHPYLLPLLDFGIAGGQPYVVWPFVPPRSLSVRLAQSGPVDVLTAGRYLDQIAGVLEYAHEHGTLHGDLTTDSLYLRPNGHIVVADLGIRWMLELDAEDARLYPYLGNSEAWAPEYLLDGPVGPYTDVYALGAVLYRLLTGYPAFSGETVEEVAQQHLGAAVPPLSLWRAGLPTDLDGIIATAMAREPERRFRQPGALANAYYEIVAPRQVGRVPFISRPAQGVQRTQGPLPIPSGPLAPSAWNGGQTRRTARLDADAQGSSALRAAASIPLAHTGHSDGVAGFERSPLWGRSNRLVRNALFLGLVLVIGVATTLALVALNGGHAGAARPTGVALFVDSPQGLPGHTDALKITIHGLAAPATGFHYDAWLINSVSEHVVALGTLAASERTFVLNYGGDGGSGLAGTNLLGVGDRVEITLEQGQVSLPVGRVVLSGAWPARAFIHIRHLLVSYPNTPGQVGLVVGVLGQVQLLSAQAQLLQSVAAGGNAVAVGCTAQNLIDIVEGTRGAHYRPLPSTCAAQSIAQVGDGFGLLGTDGYLAEASSHASLAAIAPDSTPYIRVHAGHVMIAMTNIQGWVTTVDHDALVLLGHPDDTNVVHEILVLAGHAYYGVDTNGDEQIDPVPGEAGAITGYDHAQLMAALRLTSA